MYSNKPDIKTICKRDFSDSVNNLKRYNQAPAFFDMKFAQYAVGQHYTESLHRLRIQNSDFRNCCFSAPITRTNISGSNYVNCKFEATDIQNSNFQFGTFENCRFDRNYIEGSNFSNCFMSDVTISNNRLIGSNFLRTRFRNCRFCGGEMLSSSLEFAEFQNTYFENLRLANLSMEYSEFRKVHMDNVILPFAQLPLIFGGLDYILSTSDHIAISADMGDIQSISVDEYISTFEDWKTFLYHRELYFPLSNILLAQNKTDEALESILSGILLMINHYDFRMLKYLCKLAATHPNVSKEECKKLYKRIKELISMKAMNEEQNYKYSLHIDDIRNILMDNPKGEARLSLSLQTNIASGSERQLCEIIRGLEILMDSPIFNLTAKSITIRHDSPFEIIIMAVGALYALKKVTDLISQIIHNAKVSVEDLAIILNTVKNQEENDVLDNELKKTALEKEKLELQKLQLEIKEMEERIKKENIVINITHDINEEDKIYIA
ncbi:pentapeptide repeat-containing protein [Mediterraneibacter glycyrrhizinilyticus]|nr:pentapeptide repeat-containing protein [Mediterraneibacter glycyrrhizinilyticus]MBM6855180.1 pentapeptide repeat-containing protein [Mediterraneibacter glycyrrhizinilyticus]